MDLQKKDQWEHFNFMTQHKKIYEDANLPINEETVLDAIQEDTRKQLPKDQLDDFVKRSIQSSKDFQEQNKDEIEKGKQKLKQLIEFSESIASMAPNPPKGQQQSSLDLEKEIKAKISSFNIQNPDPKDVMEKEAKAFWDFVTSGKYDHAEHMLVKYPNLLNDAKIANKGVVYGNILVIYVKQQKTHKDSDANFMKFISKHKDKFAKLFTQKFPLNKKECNEMGLTEEEGKSFNASLFIKLMMNSEHSKDEEKVQLKQLLEFSEKIASEKSNTQNGQQQQQQQQQQFQSQGQGQGQVPGNLITNTTISGDKPKLTEDEVKELNKLWAASIIEIAKAAKDEKTPNAFKDAVDKSLKYLKFDEAKTKAVLASYTACKDSLKTLKIEELTKIEKNSKFFIAGGFATSATTLMFGLAEIQSRTQIFGDSNVIKATLGALKSFTEKLGSSISMNKDLSSLAFIGLLAASSIALFSTWYVGSKGADSKQIVIKQAKDGFDAALKQKAHIPEVR